VRSTEYEPRDHHILQNRIKQVAGNKHQYKLPRPIPGMAFPRASPRHTNRAFHAHGTGLGVPETRKCECRVVESNLYPAMNSMSSALRLCLTEQMDERGMRQMWREIVRSYSVRTLTNIKDKLPTLAGIAALLKDKSGDVYAAGLWRRSLPFDLLWRCDQSGALKSGKERAPSRSWISVDGRLNGQSRRSRMRSNFLSNFSSI
jgi:hypothetical protein